jgi:type II secretory ATPase GspE/PulE/Tfp pilus assembly ATPase PilB-like protein
MLRMTPELEQIILTQPSQERLMAEAKRQGMITLRQDGIIKALEGLVSLEEVLAITAKY